MLNEASAFKSCHPDAYSLEFELIARVGKFLPNCFSLGTHTLIYTLRKRQKKNVWLFMIKKDK